MCIKHWKTQQKIRLFWIINALFFDNFLTNWAPTFHKVIGYKNDRENAKKVGGVPQHHLHHYEVHGRHKDYRRDGNKANQLKMRTFLSPRPTRRQKEHRRDKNKANQLKANQLKMRVFLTPRPTRR